MTRVIHVSPAIGCGWLVDYGQTTGRTFFGSREAALAFAYETAYELRPAVVRVYASLGVIADEWSFTDRASIRRVGPDRPREVIVDA